LIILIIVISSSQSYLHVIVLNIKIFLKNTINKENNKLVIANSIRRLYAFIIDVALIILLIMIIAPISNGFIFHKDAPLTTLLFLFGYFLIPTSIKGKTIGKWVAGIKVVDLEGNIPGPKAIPREIAGKFVSFIALSLGLIWIIFDKKNQSWHDKIAGTIVIQETNFSLFNKFFSKKK